VPAYNEERRLPKTLERITGYLSQQEYTAEIIVVDDGSQDGTARIVEAFMARSPNVSLIRNEHRGKGGTVKTGMLAGRGEYLFLCDADLSMPIEELAKFLPPLLNSYDVAIGSREAIGARRYDEPIYRHLMGRVFNLIVKLLTVRDFEDTQAGFKCFKREVAQDLFSHQTMDGWAFDVEILYIAQKRGYRVVEVPIHWYHMTNSRIEPLGDTGRMFSDVIRVRLNDLRGVYDE
jgi:dolichyl-phosphate beta-glucosyltransferase